MRGTQRLVPYLAVIAVASIVAFGATTWWMLESSDVAVLRTQPAGGSLRSTRVWYVEDGGAIWIEAATPERAFLGDVRRTPKVTLSTDDASSTYRAEVLDADSEHRRIRTLLRGKYGLRDWWIGLLQDTSRSVALRLHPAGRSSEADEDGDDGMRATVGGTQ
jgi:hypothetical protein